MTTKSEQAEMIQHQLFTREDGTVSIWDHPNFTSRLQLPDDYRPLTKLVESLEVMNRLSKQVYEERMMVLKVVGDAVCANENQLRRYLSSKFSYSQTSMHLRAMRKHGFIERQHSRLAFIGDEDDEAVKRQPHIRWGLLDTYC